MKREIVEMIQLVLVKRIKGQSPGSDCGYFGASVHGGYHGSRAGGGEAGPAGTCATADRRACASASDSGRDRRRGIGI